MRYCTNCGTQLDPAAKFCSACGATTTAPAAEPAAPAEPTYTPPAYTPPTYTPPTYTPPAYTTPAYPVATVPARHEPSTGSKVKGYVGMGLSIGGLVFAILGIIYVLIFIGAELFEEAFGCAIGFGIFSLPLSIIGKVLAGRSYDDYNTSAACSVGSKLGLAGIIVTGVMLLLGFIGLSV